MCLLFTLWMMNHLFKINPPASLYFCVTTCFNLYHIVELPRIYLSVWFYSDGFIILWCSIRTGITTSDPASCSLTVEPWLSEERPARCQSGIWPLLLLASRRSWRHPLPPATPWPSRPTTRSAFPAAATATSSSGTFTTRRWLGKRRRKWLIHRLHRFPAVRWGEQMGVGNSQIIFRLGDERLMEKVSSGMLRREGE